MTDQLPVGWEWSTLGDVADVNPRVTKKDIPDELEVSFIPMAAVTAVSGEIDLSDTQPARDLKRKSFRGFGEGDVLVAKITPSMENGKAAVAAGLSNAIGFGSTEFHVLRPLGGTLAKYLFYFVVQDRFRAEAAHNMTGTAGQLRVPPGFLQASLLPLPPLAEQERIVTAIEEHLSRLDAAEASVVSSAGRIRNLERSILQRADDATWPEQELGDLLLGIEAGKSFSTPGRPAESDEWGVIKVSAMTWGSFDEQQNKAVLDVEKVQSRYEIVPGDLLLSRANTSELVGAAVLVEETRPMLLLSDKSMRLQPDPAVDKRWLRYCLGAPSIRRQISAAATGTSDSMRNISQEKVRRLKIRVPPKDEQCRLAGEIHAQRGQRSRIEDELALSAQRLGALRRSILAAAFSGQLVPQNPDDEPASVLLERIAAERPSHTKKRRKTSA